MKKNKQKLFLLGSASVFLMAFSAASASDEDGFNCHLYLDINAAAIVTNQYVRDKVSVSYSAEKKFCEKKKNILNHCISYHEEKNTCKKNTDSLVDLYIKDLRDLGTISSN